MCVLKLVIIIICTVQETLSRDTSVDKITEEIFSSSRDHKSSTTQKAFRDVFVEEGDPISDNINVSNLDPPLEERLENVRNYTGWRMLRIYPSTKQVLNEFYKILEHNARVVVLRSYRSPLLVDILLDEDTSLEDIGPPTHNYTFTCLDGHTITNRSQARKKDGDPSDVIHWETVKTMTERSLRTLNGSETLAWDDFYRYESIVRFIKDLVLQYAGVEYVQIGTSLEGRPLLALIFSKRAKSMKRKYMRSLKKDRRQRMKGGRNPTRQELRKKCGCARNNSNKPMVFIEAGAHAREWLSPAVATYIAQQLADAGKDFLKRVSVILVPMANPDGYEFSHTTDRMWRKNRRTTSNSKCKGVDLNRNWDKAWGDSSGSSDAPCSEIYRGTSSFSEPETSVLRDLANVWVDEINFYITLHSYGEYILFPWSYKYRAAPTKKELRDFAKKMRNYLRKNGYRGFRIGQSSSMLYKSAGVSDDYFYSLGVQYSYTIELPGSNFFIAPKHIIPISSAIWDMLVCSIGDTRTSKKIKSYCDKRLVKVDRYDGRVVSGWYSKKVSLEEAQKMLLAKHPEKKIPT